MAIAQEEANVVNGCVRNNTTLPSDRSEKWKCSDYVVPVVRDHLPAHCNH